MATRFIFNSFHNVLRFPFGRTKHPYYPIYSALHADWGYRLRSFTRIHGVEHEAYRFAMNSHDELCMTAPGQVVTMRMVPSPLHGRLISIVIRLQHTDVEGVPHSKEVIVTGLKQFAEMIANSQRCKLFFFDYDVERHGAFIELIKVVTGVRHAKLPFTGA